MMKKVLVAGVAVAAAMSVAASAGASTYFAGYTTAVGPSGLTPTVNFSAPGGAAVDVTVTDCCIVGDYYAAYVDGSYIGTTPFEPLNGSTLSSAVFSATLGGGTSHSFYLVDQTTAILPAGVYVQIDSSAAPEPASWALMLIGVAGLGAAVRSRRSASLKGAVA